MFYLKSSPGPARNVSQPIGSFNRFFVVKESLPGLLVDNYFFSPGQYFPCTTELYFFCQ